jgi:hypothetical protein
MNIHVQYCQVVEHVIDLVVIHIEKIPVVNIVVRIHVENIHAAKLIVFNVIHVIDHAKDHAIHVPDHAIHVKIHVIFVRIHAERRNHVANLAKRRNHVVNLVKKRNRVVNHARSHPKRRDVVINVTINVMEHVAPVANMFAMIGSKMVMYKDALHAKLPLITSVAIHYVPDVTSTPKMNKHMIPRKIIQKIKIYQKN